MCPRALKKPAPTILYVCGHGRVKKDGVSYGNKCIISTTARGLRAMATCVSSSTRCSWAKSRASITARTITICGGGIRAAIPRRGGGVELHSRAGLFGDAEVRGQETLWRHRSQRRRRVQLVDFRARRTHQRFRAPVAGIADLKNHVYAGFPTAVALRTAWWKGHCDCMFHVNTYRWDFGQVAALVAPRPLLILNTDDDRIFPARWRDAGVQWRAKNL